MITPLTVLQFEPAIRLFIHVLIDAAYPFVYAGYFIGSAFIFKKYGVNPLAAFIPIYNWIVMLKMAGNSSYWVLGLFVPFVNVYALYKVHASIATAFNKSTLWQLGTGILPMVFIPILGFTDTV